MDKLGFILTQFTKSVLIITIAQVSYSELASK